MFANQELDGRKAATATTKANLHLPLLFHMRSHEFVFFFSLLWYVIVETTKD